MLSFLELSVYASIHLVNLHIPHCDLYTVSSSLVGTRCVCVCFVAVCLVVKVSAFVK